jgi:hypothetical protein
MFRLLKTKVAPIDLAPGLLEQAPSKAFTTNVVLDVLDCIVDWR